VLDFAEVSIGDGATVRCTRCRPADGSGGYRDVAGITADIERVVAGWAVPPGPNVELTGPEPLAHPELPAVVAAAVQAGVRRLRLLTDAAGFCVPANAEGAIASGVRHIKFALLGGTPGVHDVLAGTAGALEATSQGVRAYLEAAGMLGSDVHVSAVIPVCRHTAGDLPVTVARAAEAGADSVLLRVDDGGVDLRAALPTIAAACDTGVVNGVWVEVEGAPFCMMDGLELHVADTVRERPGEHGPGCAACALLDLCAGGPFGAAADLLAALAPPAGHERLASRVRCARTGVCE
jgi:hypothetical protein